MAPRECPRPHRRTSPALTIALLASALAAVQLTAQTAAATQQPPPGQAFGTCPPGRWYTQGGNAARNSTSATPPMLTEPQQLWRIDAGGAIHGEPLVWDDHVVIEVDVGGGKRSVQIRRLADGTQVDARTMLADQPLAPALWGDEIVIRTRVPSYELLRITGRAVTFAYRQRKKASLGPPLRVGNFVYGVVDGRLTCMRTPDFRELWQTDEATYTGQPSRCGDLVYVLRAGRRRLAVCAFAADTGRPAGATMDLPLQADVDEDCRISVAGNRLVVRCRDKILGVGQVFNAIDMQLPLSDATEPQPLQLAGDVALDAGFLLAVQESQRGPLLSRLIAGESSFQVLSDSTMHEHLLAAGPVLCGPFAYCGPHAIDLTESEIAWQRRDAPNVRAIPTTGALLLADGDALIALGAARPPDLVGHQLHELRLARTRAHLQECTQDAFASGDLELTTELLAQSRSAGVDESFALPLEKRIARTKKPPRLDSGKAQAAREAAAAVDEVALAAVYEHVAARAAEPDAPPDELRRGLRFLLSARHDHAGATAQVRALLPAGVTAAEPFSPWTWLDFVEAADQTPVAFLQASEEDLDDPTADKMKLLMLRANWRSDLVALQSRRLLIFSPVDAPGSLAKALSAGELVCDLLESMFAELPAVRQDDRAMHVLIYADRDDYIKESNKSRYVLGQAAFTAGHYSPHESLSRMFVPADDADFRRVLPTLAHELTHQWLQDRCPAIAALDPSKRQQDQPGHWIIEGFASMMEQFAYDRQARTWSLTGGDMRRLDTIANAAGHQRIPWDQLVRASAEDFARLSPKPDERLEMRSSILLGRMYQPSPKSLFYDQAATLSRYLYEAEEGRWRRQLLEYVIACYTGDVAGLDFEKAFGIPVAELEARLTAFAKERVR